MTSLVLMLAVVEVVEVVVEVAGMLG